MPENDVPQRGQRPNQRSVRAQWVHGRLGARFLRQDIDPHADPRRHGAADEDAADEDGIDVGGSPWSRRRLAEALAPIQLLQRWL
ncbi:MAG: hypothetical protein JSR72_21055 [Proteobacteria bacterium]|nr:hypothetical protein [Pseudomonadota bacterium]